jgi:hypothetical protein
MLHERQHADSRLVLSDIFNSLEPDRHKVNQNRYCRTDAECAEEIGSDATLGGNARGEVAFSCFHSGTPMKLRRRMPAQTKRTMFRAGCQSYVEPLHCRANSRHATPGVKRAVPMGSGLFYFFLIVSAEALGAVLGGSGR